MNRTLVPVTFAIAAAALSACNDGNVTARAKGKITPQNSQQVGEAISATISGSLAGGSSSGSSSKFRASSSNTRTRFATGGGASCYTVSGDESDADNDGIPLDATYTLDNCSDSYEGWTESWSGTEGITDTNPTAASYDYGLTFDLNASFVAGTDNEADHIAGSESGAQSGNTFTFVDHESDDYSGSYAGQSYSGNFADDLTYVFAATNADLTAGTYTVAGTWSENFNGQAVDTTISTPDPMVIDPACASGIVSGTVLAVSGNSSVTMTWTGCDQETITYSGPQAGS